MIENISINNYALIDHTHIELEKGFSVITGETGNFCLSISSIFASIYIAYLMYTIIK